MMVEQMHVHHSSTVELLKEGITNKKLNYFGLAIASHVSAMCMAAVCTVVPVMAVPHGTTHGQQPQKSLLVHMTE